jgi:hypothetical protein
MKKGCFVKIIVLLTILTAVVLYLINNKFDNLVFNPGKKILINQINRDLEFVKDSPQKDSLKLLINNYIMEIKNINSVYGKQINLFADSLKVALKDSIIDEREYKKLSVMLNKKVR